MKTECTAHQLEFHGIKGRQVVGRFDGGQISSDGGGILLREVERRTGILQRLSECFTDYRDPKYTTHSLLSLITQRVTGLALGYEDLNDHDTLRDDALLAVLSGKVGEQLAGRNTLNRLELTAPEASTQDRYKKIVADTAAIDTLLVDLFVDAHERVPKEIVLDIDATDDPLHGDQEGRFFHGYYRHYGYLPLYIFCVEHVLCARLRTADQDAAAGTIDELSPIIARIRAQWPHVRIIVRGDRGFCREEIMVWCEQHRVDYVLGLAKNPRLNSHLDNNMLQAKAEHEVTGKAARRFRDFRYQTLKSWSRDRRVIGKAEYLSKGENPRFIVTNISCQEIAARALYETVYCARGDMENRIKEQQLDLFADRTSSQKMRTNQLRLYFSSFAYVLMQTCRRLALAGTDMAKAQCGTIRLKLFKIGARIRISVRKVWLSFSESYPYIELFCRIRKNLQCIPIQS